MTLKSSSFTITRRFWAWYERHYTLHVGITAFLFLWQLVHLWWLSAHVVSLRLFGRSFFELSGIWKTLIIVVDYTEVPALVGVSLVYIAALRKGFDRKSALMLFFTNTQWIHLFWITDAFVLREFFGRGGTPLPAWFAWAAIGIDYLELPVIYDTVKTFVQRISRRVP